MHAELEGVICSGPRRGKQFTYALLSERAPKSRVLDREAALGELAQRYFASHGPATVRDFAWWSSLTLSEAQQAIDSVSRKLESTTLDGTSYWNGADEPGTSKRHWCVVASQLRRVPGRLSRTAAS